MQTCWEILDAVENEKRESQSRLQSLDKARKKKCVSGCDGEWKRLASPGPSRGDLNWGGVWRVKLPSDVSQISDFSNTGTMLFISKIVQDYVLRCDRYIELLFNGQLYNIRLQGLSLQEQVKKNTLKRWKVHIYKITNQNIQYIVRTPCTLFCQSLSTSLFNCQNTVSVLFKLFLS